MDILNKNQKKVLILAYDFPPYVSAGGLRPLSWYNYLHEFDVTPVVVTRQWSNHYGNHLDYIAPGHSDQTLIDKTEKGIIIRSPYKPNRANKIFLKYGETKYKWLRKIISAYYEIFQFVLPIGSKRNLYIEAKNYLKHHKVDAIIATGDPFILFKYANDLSKKFGIPWIADYRDIWSNNFPLKNKTILKTWFSFHERKLVKNAYCVLFVSEFVKEKTQMLLKPNTCHYIVPNGYDPNILTISQTTSQQYDVLNIGYAGSILQWHPIDYFLSIVNQFLLENEQYKLNINFYGTNLNEEIKSLVNKNYSKLRTCVNVFPKLPYSNVITKLSENNVLLLFNYYSFMGTKIYDYLGIRRKILLCFSDDEIVNDIKIKHYTIDDQTNISSHLQEDLIEKTRSGIVVKDATHLKLVLKELSIEFSEKAHITCNTQDIENYSRKNQVSKLAEILKRIKVTPVESNKIIFFDKGNDNKSTNTSDMRNKKALILAYDFPPYVSVGGLRPYFWYLHFAEYGISPVVITRQWNHKYKNSLDFVAPGFSNNTITEESNIGTIIRTPYFPNLSNRIMLRYGESRYRLLRKTISSYFEILQWISFKGTKSNIYKAAKEYLKNNPVDIIIATSEPFILFKYASALSKKHNIQWIADYRDPWSSSININKKHVLKSLYKLFETRNVKSASAIVTVSEFVKSKIFKIFPNKDFYIIPNGFNSEITEKLHHISPSDSVLNIAFIGTINPWHPLSQVMSVYTRFLNDNPETKIKLNFYGINQTVHITKQIFGSDHLINKNITIYPKLANDDLLKEMAKNHLMLLFNDYSLMGTKIYDYLGIKKPILLCFSDDDDANVLKRHYHYVEKDVGYSNHLQEDLIRKTDSGYIIKNQDHLYDTLKSLTQEFKNNKEIICNTKNTNEYSRKHLAAKYTEIINRIIK
ncbi:MAG: hypothetical protein CVU05_07710 [Bacteroidetes bacterium HGW-Bacteroidetes-21]|nr:MAG: hypothetical protein CVU05_07710 [Bacteroidetes bacterium HGW-Bacteroidetes-21]